VAQKIAPPLSDFQPLAPPAFKVEAWLNERRQPPRVGREPRGRALNFVQPRYAWPPFLAARNGRRSNCRGRSGREQLASIKEPWLHGKK
jgi:hypothetical protein